MTMNALRTYLARGAATVALVSIVPLAASAQTPDTTTRVVTQPVERDEGVDLGWLGLLGLAGLLGLRRPAPVVHHETVRTTSGTGSSDPGMRR
jgi:MYXO-CTERM domain-containing protein